MQKEILANKKISPSSFGFALRHEPILNKCEKKIIVTV